MRVSFLFSKCVIANSSYRKLIQTAADFSDVIVLFPAILVILDPCFVFIVPVKLSFSFTILFTF